MMHLVNVERRVVKLELSTVEDDDVVARMHAVIQQCMLISEMGLSMRPPGSTQI